MRWTYLCAPESLEASLSHDALQSFSNCCALNSLPANDTCSVLMNREINRTYIGVLLFWIRQAANDISSIDTLCTHRLSEHGLDRS